MVLCVDKTVAHHALVHQILVYLHHGDFILQFSELISMFLIMLLCKLLLSFGTDLHRIYIGICWNLNRFCIGFARIFQLGAGFETEMTLRYGQESTMVEVYARVVSRTDCRGNSQVVPHIVVSH